MKHITLTVAATLFLASAAQATDSWEVAKSLGTLLGSEEACELTYNQEAIAKFIEANVSPADMEFAGDLDMVTENKKDDLYESSASKIATHCIQIKRTAKHYGLID